MYGINTEDSDHDYAGIYLTDKPGALFGLATDDSWVHNTTTENESYWELRHFLHLCRRSTVKTVELMFNDTWLYSSDVLKDILQHRSQLIDTNHYGHASMGYASNEIMVGFGQKAGDLGASRKELLAKYGFSPKNVAHAIRILLCSAEFLRTGVYPVHVRKWKPALADQLLKIRTNPELFSVEELQVWATGAMNEFDEARKAPGVVMTFDTDVAVDICKRAYKKLLV